MGSRRARMRMHGTVAVGWLGSREGVQAAATATVELAEGARAKEGAAREMVAEAKAMAVAGVAKAM